MAISTRSPSLMPDILALRRVSQSLALLDAILSPSWEYRYYSFDAHWANQQSLASMRNGEGDSYVAWFCSAGVVLKGFAHESLMSPYRVVPPRIWPGIYYDLPEHLRGFLSDAAFSPKEVTFCLWRTVGSPSWQLGDVQFPDGEDPDGSAQLLKLLDGIPQTYQLWAEEYYETRVELSAVVHIFEHRPLTENVITAVNADMTVNQLTSDLTKIGYP